MRSVPFPKFQSIYFHGFSKLMSLSLSPGDLERVPPINALARTIQCLHLDHNHITRRLAQKRIWKIKGIKDCKQQNLFCQCKHLDAYPNISSIIIPNNKITHFETPGPYFQPMRTKRFLLLAGNLLDCTSQLSWVVSTNWIGFHPLSRRILCNTPSCMKGKSLLSLSEYITSHVIT